MAVQVMMRLVGLALVAVVVGRCIVAAVFGFGDLGYPVSYPLGI